MRKILLFSGMLLSVALIWFAASNYISARPIAEENLRGLALSLTSAIENITLNDPSLHGLSSFRTHDIAYFALIDGNGLYRFHSNPDMIGSAIQGAIPVSTLSNGVTSGTRITLGTGESAFEFNAPMYLPGETLVLRLTLHTYRADTVIRRARLNLLVLCGLLAAGWMLALTLYGYTRREERHQLAMARRESLAELGEMGAMLAHEIRNPLAGIKGYAQIIEKKPQDKRNSGFAQRIVAETQRLEELVNDLLAYARNSSELVASVYLSQVIDNISALLRYEAEQLHIDIATDCQEGLRITGNKDRIGQALLNLGKNALQSMPEGGKLRIWATASGKHVILKVSDTGQGISPEELPKIFEPFYTTKAKGTGLGLALCRKIVEEHGGVIEVQSIVGQGTTVSINIPVNQSRS